MHSYRSLQDASLKHRYWQRIANTHQVANIDQQIDARNIALFGQAAQKCLRSTPVLRRIHSKTTKRTPPGRQGLDLAQGSAANALQDLLLVSLVESLQTCRCWAVRHILCQNSSANDLWIPRQNVRVILENMHSYLHFKKLRL